ncbi:hypothetical protein EYR38_010814 [Pleurotus pulmonarius]|nr:hypothetical protein EYR38_010814 [Pleurotus pulmonarius]
MKLTRTYQIGDVIYLFGFSRGAYIVRFLAGMIGQVGLLRDESDYRTECGGVFHAEDSSDDSSRDLVGAAFRWMVYEAAEHGIELRLPQPGPLRPIRSTGETYSKRRALGSHQLVHESVFDAIDKIHYTPIAKPYRNWNDLLFRSAVQEYEPYLAGDKDPSVLKAEDLEGLVSTSIGLRSFLLRPDALDIVFHVLGDTDLNHPRQDLKALAVALKSLPTQREELRTHTYSEIRELATKLGLPPGEQNQILGKVGQGPFFAKRDVATLVAYSQRGSHIASVYNQGTVRLWFANTGNKDAGPHQLGPPSTSILSMAFALIDDGNAEAIVAGQVFVRLLLSHLMSPPTNLPQSSTPGVPPYDDTVNAIIHENRSVSSTDGCFRYGPTPQLNWPSSETYAKIEGMPAMATEINDNIELMADIKAGKAEVLEV